MRWNIWARAANCSSALFFALAIFAPLSLGYFLLGLWAESAQALASLPFALFFVAFGQFAIYRARRYRLHRTSWRGVRCGMSGSGWAFAGRAMLWGSAVLLSLGLALPWAEVALERYKMRNSFYGELPGDFVGRGGELLKRGWWIWLLAILAAAVIFALTGYQASLQKASVISSIATTCEK